MVFDPIGLAAAIWEGLPYFPPCPGARILSQGTGPGELGGRRTVVDTVVWQCPGGRIVTKVGPVATDPATGRPFPDPAFFATLSQENDMTDCISNALTAAHPRRPNILLPKPGHLLAHVGIVADGACFALQAIEGALPGSLSFVGIKADGESVETVTINLAANSGAGALASAIGTLPPRLRGRMDDLRIVAGDGSIIEPGAIHFVFQVTYRVPDGVPNGAILKVRQRGRESTVLISGFEEGLGFFEFLLAVVVVVALTAVAVSVLKSNVRVENSTEAETTPEGVKVKTKQTYIANDGVAPIDSGTVVAPGN